MGDLNAEPDSPAIRYLQGFAPLPPLPHLAGGTRGQEPHPPAVLRDAWRALHPEPEPRSADADVRYNELSFPSDEPKKRIDMILAGCVAVHVVVRTPAATHAHGVWQVCGHTTARDCGRACFGWRARQLAGVSGCEARVPCWAGPRTRHGGPCGARAGYGPRGESGVRIRPPCRGCPLPAAAPAYVNTCGRFGHVCERNAAL